MKLDPETPAPAAQSPGNAPDDLASVHTANFPAMLQGLGISLLVTTYQAGKLIVIREQAGRLNTHFRNFVNPMGLAYDGQRLAVGTKREVWEFVNQPEAAARLEPRGTHDAAFLPRLCRFTGDIKVHEMAYLDGELWAVNTRFSCLCTFDELHSFVPRWQPAFISELSPGDRCHLNGMAVSGDAVQYVTALGTTDTPHGWREHKATGGCLLDVRSNVTVAHGISMPHSPRVHQDRLWMLESGEGSLAVVDPATGRWETVLKMPGFTRGLDFFGPYAFIGLSQVRESNIFGGLPITDRLPEHERTCGIYVVDLRTGRPAAFLRFESGVREVFAIQVVPQLRHPDVVLEDEELLDGAFLLQD